MDQTISTQQTNAMNENTVNNLKEDLIDKRNLKISLPEKLKLEFPEGMKNQIRDDISVKTPTSNYKSVKRSFAASKIHSQMSSTKRLQKQRKTDMDDENDDLYQSDWGQSERSD